MRNLTRITMRLLCGALFLTAAMPLFADDANEDRDLPAGADPQRLSTEDYKQFNAQLCAYEPKMLDENVIEKELSMDKNYAVEMPEAMRFGNSLFSTHPGSTHYIGSFLVDLKDGALLTVLEDGSKCAINPDDTNKTQNWLDANRHTVIIIPNHLWFSSYSFRLVNQSTNSSVEANLRTYLNPTYHTALNHRIIDIRDNKLWLEDGSKWQLSYIDLSTEWKVGDTVIIGINDDYSKYLYANILINARKLRPAFVRAKCVSN